MSSTVYTSRVTNWPLFWTVNGLAVVLVAGSAAPSISVAPALLIGAVVVVVNLMMTSLRATVGPNGVIVRFGVFGLPRFRYRPEAIESAAAEVIPAYRLGGYGVHWSPWRGTRLTVRSGPSLRLRLTSGRSVLITVADPDAAVALLTSHRTGLPR